MASTGDQLAPLPVQQAGALEGFSSSADYLVWLDAYLSAETKPVGTNATVTTDQADYAPGATATITASGFATGATVTFGRADLPSDPGDDPGDPDIYGTFTVTDGGPGDLDGLANGTVVTSWAVPSDNDGSGSRIPDALNATVLVAASGSDGQVATTTFTDAADPSALAGDLDGDGTINSADDDIDGDGTLNLDDRTAYRNGAEAIPTFTDTAPIRLDFRALPDGATPFEGGFTGLAQTSNGSPELNYSNNTAVGGTAAATVQNGRLVIQTTNDDTADADSGFTFLADTEGKSFIFAGTFDNPVFNATALPTFSQYGLLLSLTGADGVTGANFVKLVTGNPGAGLELSGKGGFSGPPKPPLPAGVTQINYAQVALSLEATVTGGSVTFVGMASYLDASGDVLGTVLTGVGTVNADTPLYNALTGAPGAPTVAFGITSTDFGSGGSFNIGLQDLSLSKPEEVIDVPAGPNFGLEVLASLTAADGIATGGSYGQGVFGSANLDVMSTVNNIQSSNFGANSFKVTNTGTKKIAAVFIDFREALFGDSVIDTDGSAGDSSAKKFQTDLGATETAAFFDASNAKVYYLPGEPPLPNTTGTGKASAGGFRGLLLKAGTDGGGFESGETVGFSGDMDPNSLAGLLKSGVNGVDTNAINGWDVGGISGAEIAGSKFFVLFDDGSTASGVLGNSGTQAGAIGKAVQGQAEVPVTVDVNGGSGVYGAGGLAPTIVVSGTPGQRVRVVLAKGLQPVTNDTAGVGGTTGPKSLVEDRLAITHPDFPVSNAFDFQTLEVTIGSNGTVIVPTGALTYSTTSSGVSFPGFDVAPIAISAVAINNEGFAIGSVARDYLTNPTATPVKDGVPGYFKPSGSGNNLFYKIQIEDVAALNGGTNPNGKWKYLTSPDSQGRQTGFQGNGYYVYGSSATTGIYPVIEAETLEFEIDVPTALVGKTLSFRVRASRDGLAADDQQNDIWLGIQRADGTGSIKDFLVGNGTNKPQPTSGDFIRVFGGPNNGKWGYASAVDGTPKDFTTTIKFSNSGRYILQVAGRSEGFHIDWIELYTGSAPAMSANNSVFVNTAAQPVVLANAIPDQVFADGVTDIFNLPTGTFGDPNNDPITYNITVTSAHDSDVSSVKINATTGQITGLSTLAIGTYQVLVAAQTIDGIARDTFKIDVVDQIALKPLRIAVNAKSDDYEEKGGNGSPALEFGFNGSAPNEVGIRFSGITIPVGAVITNAYIEVKADKTTTASANFTIGIQGSENATTFTSAKDLLGRKSAGEISWSNVEPWTVGKTYKSPNLSTLIQQVIGADGVSSGALAFLINGSGTRVAESFGNGTPPTLVIEAVLGAINSPPMVTADDPTPPLSTLTFAAEAADVITNYREEPIGVASGGTSLSLVGGSSNESGRAAFVFGDGPQELAGSYDIIIGTFDESDGLASFTVDLTDFETGTTTEIGRWALNASLGSAGANATSLITPTVATGIGQTAGDIITVNGLENAGEPARLDYLQLVPTL